MIVVPFLWFLLLFVFQLKRSNGRIDIGLFITAMFGISSLFSILGVCFHVDGFSYNISFIATFVYCFLLTINVLPFLWYSHLKRKIVPLSSNKPLKILAWVVLSWFIFSVSHSAMNVYEVLTGDIRALRAMVYADEMEAGWLSVLPMPIKLIVTLLNLCFGMPWVLMLLAFFSFYIQKLPLKYFLFYFISSLSGPLAGIQVADRSATAYWIISLIAIYIFFFRIIPQKQRKYINIFLLIIGLAMVFYLSFATIGRFENSNSYVGQGISNIEASIIGYLGQPFPNFCYFFDDFKPAFSNLNLLFPATAKYIFGSEMVGGVNLQEVMTLKTGVATGAFYTYLGQICIFCSMFVMFLFSFVYTAFANFKLKTDKQKPLTLKSCFIYLFLSSIMWLGLFAYPYSSPTRTIAIVFSLMFIKYAMKLKIKI